MAGDDPPPPPPPTPAQVAANAAANAAAKAVAASSRIKARPREYVDGENFSTYLNHFNRMANANNWSDEVKLVQLETLLKGKAQKHFEMFIEEDPDIVWHEMIENLQNELRPSPQQSVDTFSQMRLDSRSPKEFYAALVRQSRIAHGDMDETARHVIVRAQMLQVLPKQLRTDASKQDDLSSLDKEDLLSLLTRIYEADYKDNAEEVRYEPMVCKVQPDVQKTTDSRLNALESDMSEIKSLLKQIGNDHQKSLRQERRNPRPSYQRMESVTCYRCQEKGHFASSCLNSPACRFCRNTGHRSIDCPHHPDSKNV